MDRATVARTETGARGISLNDALLFAAALGVSPVQMIAAPEEDVNLALAPNLEVEPTEARRFIRGEEPLSARDEDVKVFFEEVAPEEWGLNRNRAYSEAALLVDLLRHYLSGTYSEPKDTLLGDLKSAAETTLHEVERFIRTEQKGR